MRAAEREKKRQIEMYINTGFVIRIDHQFKSAAKAAASAAWLSRPQHHKLLVFQPK